MGLLAPFTPQQNSIYIKQALVSQTCGTEDESLPMKERFLWEEKAVYKKEEMQRLSSNAANCHCL